MGSVKTGTALHLHPELIRFNEFTERGKSPIAKVVACPIVNQMHLTVNVYECCQSSDAKDIRFGFAVGAAQPKERNTIMPVSTNPRALSLELTQNITQQTTVTLAPFYTDPATGERKPTTVDGPPVWTVVSGQGAVIAAADGLSATLRSPDSMDDTLYRVTGDVDLGATVKPLSDDILVHNTAVPTPEATSLGLVVGVPVPKV